MAVEREGRDLDNVKTSMNVQDLNNLIISFRPTVKKARIQVIQKLSRQITIYKNKKGTDSQIQSNIKKANRLFEELKILKGANVDRLAKFSLGNTFTIAEAAQKGTVEEKAQTRIAYHKLLHSKVTKWRQDHDDWKSLASFVKSHISRRYKKKKEKSKTNQVSKSSASDLSKSLTLENPELEDDSSSPMPDDALPWSSDRPKSQTSSDRPKSQTSSPSLSPKLDPRTFERVDSDAVSFSDAEESDDGESEEDSCEPLQLPIVEKKTKGEKISPNVSDSENEPFEGGSEVSNEPALFSTINANTTKGKTTNDFTDEENLAGSRAPPRLPSPDPSNPEMVVKRFNIDDLPEDCTEFPVLPPTEIPDILLKNETTVIKKKKVPTATLR